MTSTRRDVTTDHGSDALSHRAGPEDWTISREIAQPSAHPPPRVACECFLLVALQLTTQFVATQQQQQQQPQPTILV